MLEYPNINPVAISLGPLNIYWYGITYLVGFSLAWLLAKKRAAKPNSGWNNEEVSDLIFFGAVGVVLGGRIGYMLFYNFSTIIAEPLSLLRVWEGGMSFHGGFLGVIIALTIFARNNHKSAFEVLDFIAPMVPIGLGAGRIGNFIGGELWGRVTEVPWGMVFPGAGALARHPSQLYQFGLEGLGLFVILWFYSSKPRPTFAVAGMFSLLYGMVRFFVEFFRQPDEKFGFIAFDWLTMGQLLSMPMILAGGVVLYLSYKNNTFGKIA